MGMSGVVGLINSPRQLTSLLFISKKKIGCLGENTSNLEEKSVEGSHSSWLNSRGLDSYKSISLLSSLLNFTLFI